MGKKLWRKDRQILRKRQEPATETPIKAAIKEFLEGIGTVEPTPFEPSPFQLEALAAVLEGDTMVVAPTGSGKTWIAEQSIERLLREGGRSWYTTPLKALSNQKYDAFCHLFGEENVGLLTGERRENSRAPIIVATTEVLRNVLYSGLEVCDLIVLDEAHYIADPERGVTWEEVIILAPEQSRLLLLSATISNADELAGWMEEVRGRRPFLISVKTDERPVPLRYGILDRYGRAIPAEVTERMNARRLRGVLWDRFDPTTVVGYLAAKDLLPAIVFLPRRRDCDEAVRRFYRWGDDGRSKERQRILEEVAERRFGPENHPMLPFLLRAGVAPHHAGHLTAWKLLVERMLRQGLVRAVFATTTLAAGLDVPARSVVLPTLQTRDEEGKRSLTALEFHQMTGRAGRRGKDRVGFVLLLPRQPDDLALFRELVRSRPEALESAFRLQYYQILNLLANRSFEKALGLMDRSFAVYQRARRNQKKAQIVRRQLRLEFERRARILQTLCYLTEDWQPTDEGKWALLIRHERCLFVAEALRSGALENLSPEELAGWCAALTSERVPRFPVGRLDFGPLRMIAESIERLEHRYKVPPSGLLACLDGGVHSDANRKGSAVMRWVEGKISWRSLIARTGSDEGDIQRLILQTAELLRQLEDLSSSISIVAREARVRAMREPVADFVRSPFPPPAEEQRKFPHQQSLGDEMTPF